MKKGLSEVELSYRMLSHLRAAGVALDELLRRRGQKSTALDRARATIETDWRKAMGAYVAAKVWEGTDPGRN